MPIGSSLSPLWGMFQNGVGLGSVQDDPGTMDKLDNLSDKLRNYRSQGNWKQVKENVSKYLAGDEGLNVRGNPITPLTAGKFAMMCHMFAGELINKNEAFAGLNVFLKAIGKLQNEGEDGKGNVITREDCLTSVHSDILRLALASKCFSGPILNLIFTDYSKLSVESSNHVKNILLFFYYGGLVATAVKKFSRGLYMFEVCLTMPNEDQAKAVSKITVEAYKKYILVWLIIHGGDNTDKDLVSNLSKYTNSNSEKPNKMMKSYCQAYHDVIEGFYSDKEDTSLEKMFAKHHNVFQDDGNAGLIDQVTAASQKAKIKRLTKVFITLSLQDVADRSGMKSAKDAEKCLVSMIQDGSIFAKISHKDGMVKFEKNPEKYNNVKTLRFIEENVKGIIDVTNQIGDMDERLKTSANFQKAVSGVKGGSGSAITVSDSIDMDFPGFHSSDFGGGRGPSSTTTALYKRKLPSGARGKRSSTSNPNLTSNRPTSSASIPIPSSSSTTMEMSPTRPNHPIDMSTNQNEYVRGGPRET